MTSKTWRVTIDTPDFEQNLYVEEPDSSTEETVREKYGKQFTVYEVCEVDDDE